MATVTARVLDFPEPFNLDQSIRQALATHDDVADPRVIGQYVAGVVPESELRNVVADLIGDRVREIVRTQRIQQVAAPRRSAKWAAGAERAQDVAIFRQRVAPGGVWKFLGDCTREDVDKLVAEYRERAWRNEKHAQRYQRLSNLMGSEGVEVVADLAPERVLEVLS